MDTDYEQIRELPNGYTIGVTPLPPYYMDVIKDAYPYKDYPKRKVVLIGGDIVEWRYDPPQEEPSPENKEDFQLFHTWHAVEAYNTEMDTLRMRARVDMLYATCVSIKDGPRQIEDNDWVEEVEGAIILAGRSGWRVPKHPGARKVVFLKTQVVTDDAIHDFIMSSAVYIEASEQGVINALHNFRD